MGGQLEEATGERRGSRGVRQKEQAAVVVAATGGSSGARELYGCSLTACVARPQSLGGGAGKRTSALRVVTIRERVFRDNFFSTPQLTNHPA